MNLDLQHALDDERKAEATYAAVLERFGPVRPFIKIIEAERRHANAIERQMLRLGFAIPENVWLNGVETPNSLAAACDEAIAADVENIALYERLVPEIDDSIVRQVLENLQNASRSNHLPAFRRARERMDGGGNDEGGSGRHGGGGRRH